MKYEIFIFVNFDSFSARACTCKANYLVGTRMTPEIE